MIFNITGGGGGTGGTLTVTAPIGITVTVSKDEKNKTKIVNADGFAVFKGLETGTWRVTITDGEQTASRNVDITVDYGTQIAFVGIPVFNYTGTYAIENDAGQAITETEGNWRIRFLTSGTLTFTDLKGAGSGIDVFLLGGGGGGGVGRDPGDGKPGGGGYYNTVYDVDVDNGTEYEIVIGSGGAAGYWGGDNASGTWDGKAGGSTTAFENTVSGGNGGGNGWGSAAAGCHTTTNGFDESGSAYSGTGANNVAGTANKGNGGDGGRGSTVAGKAGGSGIVIIRNAREVA